MCCVSLPATNNETHAVIWFVIINGKLVYNMFRTAMVACMRNEERELFCIHTIVTGKKYNNLNLPKEAPCRNLKI